jgi:hypothetical protein
MIFYINYRELKGNVIGHSKVEQCKAMGPSETDEMNFDAT